MTMLPRRLFSPEHEQFREQVRRFVASRIAPFHLEWEKAGQVPRTIWTEAGELGMLCCTVESRWGGSEADYLYGVVVLEEMAYAHAPGPGFNIHSEMAAPYFTHAGSEEQKAKWLPRLVTGEAIAGIAMTEPGAGSDLRSIRTHARRVAEGWRLSGQKVFISNGQIADVFIVAAKTDNKKLSLFVVDASLPGINRGRNLEKIGNHAQDTSELFLNDVLLQPNDLLGVEGEGLKYLMHGLSRERLSICVTCQARAEAIFRDTTTYVSDRHVFGQPLSEFQNTRFSLAAVKADLTAGRALVDSLIADHIAGRLNAATAAAGKLWVTEMLGRCADACLQLHGGWGYMSEYAIGRAWADARVERIAGGSSEIMKEIIARTIWPHH